MTIFETEKMKRKWGRRTGGDRRSFDYAAYVPERRAGERRKHDRRKE